MQKGSSLQFSAQQDARLEPVNFFLCAPGLKPVTAGMFWLSRSFHQVILSL